MFEAAVRMAFSVIELKLTSECELTSSSANARSRADWNRSSGRFARQRLTIAESAGGTSFRIVETSGG